MADVKLPVIGNVNKKALGISAAAAVGVLIILYLRRGKSALSASSSAGSNGANSTTAADNADDIDPATGYPYGSPQDEAALAAQTTEDTGGTGTTDIDPLTGYPYGSDQDQQALAQLGYGSGSTAGSGGSTGGTGTGVTTNAEWEQEAIGNLESGGVDATTISNAESGLPRYLAKLSLSSAQATAVQLAVGLTGEPPVGGPFSIIPTPGGSGGSGSGSGTVTVPNVEGQRVEDANAALSKVGLTSHLSTTRKPNVAYYVNSQTPGAGKKVAAGSTVDLGISTKK
jgi:hypothetical protein